MIGKSKAMSCKGMSDVRASKTMVAINSKVEIKVSQETIQVDFIISIFSGCVLTNLFARG